MENTINIQFIQRSENAADGYKTSIFRIIELNEHSYRSSASGAK